MPRTANGPQPAFFHAPAGAPKAFIHWLAVRAIPMAWLMVLLFLMLFFGSVRQLHANAYTALAVAGLLYCLFFERNQWRALVGEHRALLTAAVLVVLLIAASEAALLWRLPQRRVTPLPSQVGLLLCIAPLAVILRDRTRLRALAAVLVALSLYHVVTLPLEAITGTVFHTQTEALFPREMGPLNYQAHGLAWQVYYFPGLLLGLFFLASGLVVEEGVVRRWTVRPGAWLAAGIAWTAAIACIQSRSALAGTAAATALGYVALSGNRRALRTWLVLGALAILGVALYLYLFVDNKSSFGLRWEFMKLFWRHGWDAEWLWTGRGYRIDPDPEMQLPGLQTLLHSHNDIIQVFFTWGVPVLVAYVALWALVVRLAVRFWRDGRYWPVLALVAVGPSFLTDLGLHNVEKASFLAVLAGMAMALWPATPPQAVKPSS